ncbi:cytochrome P450 monooxygenase-like protein [Xylariaceae sp. FL1019]|nr:cytochrome P450 monooxygenase-like protein [Xylariaceae sp. FL1019]
MSPMMATPSSHVGSLALLAIITVPLYYVWRCVYRYFFHPLARYPGPKLAAVSELWHIWSMFSDREIFNILDLHKKYGDVVRIGPNELSFASSQAYQDIYNHTSKGKPRFLKTEFYDNGDPNPRITSARDPAVHARQRKALSNAFSAKSLRDQEVVVQKYMDMLVKQLSVLGEDGKKALNMSAAFNWLTFDIIGDLAFGEPFGAVEEGRTPFWVSLILDATFTALMATMVKRKIPLLKPFMSFVLPKGADEKRKAHYAMSKEKARKRIQAGDTGRDDFFSHMLKKGTMSESEIVSQASTLIVAGSETTATSLAGTTWYLLKNPDAMSKLQDEVRGAFDSLDQITGDTTVGMPYLHGVIEESLRLFPPAALGLPRYSPGTLVDGHYVPAGTTVSVNPLTTARDPRYWHEPESFIPERWIGEGLNDERKASQPFSSGPRACLGINLAYMEMRIILAKIVFAYDWELAVPLDTWMESCTNRLLWEKPDLMVKYHPRVAV